MPAPFMEMPCPPITITSPKLPLWLAWARAAFSPIGCCWPASHAVTGGSVGGTTPRSSSQTFPAASRPWAVKRPGLSVRSESVCLGPGRKCGDVSAVGSSAPVSAFSPLGKSTHRTSSGVVRSRDSQAPSRPSTGRMAPMPIKASIARSNSSGGCSANSTPLCCAAASAWRASAGRRLSSDESRVQWVTTTLGEPPWACAHRCRWAAATRPSPPLLPGPQATQMVRACGRSASASRATESPARDIRAWMGRCASASCSMRRVVSTLYRASRRVATTGRAPKGPVGKFCEGTGFVTGCKG